MLLSKIGSFNFHIESYVCDFKEQATLTVIGNFILQAATIHAQQRGFGYEAISKDNAAWVLSRIALEMDEYPGYDQNLTVETWIEDVTRYFTQRCFRFINHEKKIIGYARTIWAAIDVISRRPIDLLTWRPDLADYIDVSIDCPVGKPSKIPAVEEIESTSGYTVRYSDIDINRHMNSVKYIEHMLDVFDLDTFRKSNIHRFEMVYLTEGAFGDKLKLYRKEINTGEFLVDTKKGEESICRGRIIWK